MTLPYMRVGYIILYKFGIMPKSTDMMFLEPRKFQELSIMPYLFLELHKMKQHVYIEMDN